MKSKIKFALGQIEVIPGRPDLNTQKIIQEIGKAKERGMDVIVFPEMAVPGYLLGDDWENEYFINDLLSYNSEIRAHTDGITAIWGNVGAHLLSGKVGEDGRVRKFNAVYVASDGEWVDNGAFKGHSFKTLMPKYREFDDERHFFSMIKLAHETNTSLSDLLKPFPIKVRGEIVKIGAILCEDMWCQDYSDNPTEILVKNGAEIIVNISCSPWTWRKNDKRHRVVASLLEKCPAPFIYVNNVGIQNNGKNIFLFDGKSTVYNPNGSVRICADAYADEVLDIEIDGENHEEYVEDFAEDRDVAELYNGLIYGIDRFMKSINKKDLVIGLSGGIDSAVVACLMTEVLGREHVFAVNMPSKFNSKLTRAAAFTLACNLGINYNSFPIQNAVDITVEELRNTIFIRNDKGVIESRPLDVTDFVIENIQARDRGSRVLAAIAACLDAVYTNNGNKTETTVGYCTLYGDVDGAFAPIADLWKFEVYQLANYINRKKRKGVIPEEIINVVPSAELSSAQDVTQGKGDPLVYPYHDKLFRSLVEFRFDPEKILDLYSEGILEETLMMEKGTVDKYFPTTKAFIDDLERWWKLYKISVFKRIQAPPIIAVSRRAFGFDLRETQLQSSVYYSQRYSLIKNKLLNV